MKHIIILFFIVMLLAFDCYSQTSENDKFYKLYLDLGINISQGNHNLDKAAVYGPILGLTVLNHEKHMFISIRNATYFCLSNNYDISMRNKKELLIDNFSNISYLLIGYQIFKLGKTPATIDLGGVYNYQGGINNYIGFSSGFAINFDWLKIEIRHSLPFDIGNSELEPRPLSIALIYRFAPKNQ